MLLLVKLAWRNSFRNKRRTFLAGLAIGIGLGALIFVDALMIGMTGSMIRTATDTFLGHAQIHRKGFRDTLEVEKTIRNSDEILENLKSETEVERFAPRTACIGMITSPANVSSVMLYGIDPPLEEKVSKIDEAIVKGDFLGEDGQDRILIGTKLAETLEVSRGDRVVVTVAEATTGDLSQEMFRVGGIFHFNIREMDGGMAFINLARSQKMLGLGNGIHEIAIDFKESSLAEDRSLDFWDRYSRDGNEALAWTEIMPALSAVRELTKVSIHITAVILFSIVVLGIMNALFMSLYERMFEFGILRAVGTRPFKMALMILVETATLALISILIGAVLGLGASLYFSVHGIDYTGIEFAGVTFREPIFPVVRVYQYYKYPIYLFLFTIFVGVYPAIYAARMKPVDAMKKSL